VGRAFVIIGGGPAGLTAALELARLGEHPQVLERDAIVGGIARTETYRGFHFDMGGHRFFTKRPEIQRFWEEVLGDDFLCRPRLSRIFYRGRFFHYPLRPLETLRRLGVVEAVRIVLSYARAQAFPQRPELSFEQWVTNRFGHRLFATFFKTYTEKVWGIPCTELRAEWAAQRIRNLSMKSILLRFLRPPPETITSLIEEFHYPRLGPGMMWRAVADEVARRGGSVCLGGEVTRIVREGSRLTAVEVSGNGTRRTVPATDVITSMPVTELVKRLDPPPPPEVLESARALRYRDLLTVCLIVDRAELFPDNWIYVHDPRVGVARIQNFKNWSPDMVPDAGKTSLGLEYFCNEGDALWCEEDAALVDRGRREVAAIGLARAEEVVDGCVFRVRNAYPVYDSAYAEHLAVVRRYVDGLANCQTIGRNGLHRYNNQDHSMLTAQQAVRNALFGERHDLWSVNTEAEYHEEAPRPAAAEEPAAQAVAGLLEVLDPIALGASAAAVCATLLFLATMVLVVRGGVVVGPTLGLLAQYLPGYRVTGAGSFVGLAYGAGLGFGGGWAFAWLRNLAPLVFLSVARRQNELRALGRLLE
jgi:protoporphyrinogen oxidase